ncbi:MAG: hypothetical protein IJ224_00980 [Lachnospiraceae bacterium]|nr:hypothetical protein [Lachnospiraceae bacterium]
MKKKFYIIAIMTLIVCMFTGCGKKKEESVSEDSNKALKDDIVEFVNNKLPSIEGDRENAVAIYNSYFESDDVDLAQFSSDLQGTAIPDMQNYINSLTSIDVSTDEVKNLKDLYLQSAQKQLDAMNKVAAAINEENPDYLVEADTLIKESEDLILQYQTQLRTLAMDNDIVVNGSFSEDISSGTDAIP